MISCNQLGKCGRLGNQLWQIASTIGIADTLRQEVGLPHDWDYRPFFRIPDEFFHDYSNPGPRGLEKSWREAHQTGLVDHIDPRAREYLQDYNLWKHIEDNIWSWFQPSNLALTRLQSYPVLWIKHPTLSIHVRRGDNAAAPNPNHPVRPTSYYRQSPFLIDGQFESILVFSDDIPWSMENLGDLEAFWPIYFFDEGGKPRKKEHEKGYKTDPFDDWIDLQMMALQDRHIISNSTYAWWGAFLSDDPAPIYPWPFFGPALDYIDCSLMFPEHWQRVDHGQIHV